MKRSYPTDLSDEEWKHIEPFLPAPKRRGRQRIHSSRQILNAVFYVLRSGCPWRLLPYEYPPWKTVYHYFRQWRINGTLERLNAVLRERLRMCLGRNPHPSAGIADSQSSKTTGGIPPLERTRSPYATRISSILSSSKSAGLM